MDIKTYQDSYFSLLSFEKSFRQFNQQKIGGADIPLSSVMVLRYLTVTKGCGQKELTVTFNASSAAMAVTINKLEEKGLIHKESDSEDKRNNIITITEQGEALLEDILANCGTKPEGTVEEPLSHEELTQLKKLQNKLFRQLKIATATV